MRDFIRFWKDLQGLFAIHASLLTATLLAGNGRQEDIRVQAVFALFVLPGWLLAARWTRSRGGWVRRYCHALITSFLVHGWLAAAGSYFRLEIHDYFVAFGLLTVLSLVDCWRRLQTESQLRPARIAGSDLLVWIAVLLLVVVAYRAPRSNDIGQFLLQQQDAVVTGQLAPSSIGVTGMGIDRAMPRWRANYWHVWPVLVAKASRVSVTGTLYWFVTIPLAFASFVCLLHCIRSLCGRRVPLWAVTLAVLGPVILWYRAYNAFTYSFRLTNSFCLDKDFCLFFLVPALLYLTSGWLRGARHFLPILVLAIPAVLRFHPMTAVYLILLTPFVLISYQRLAVTVTRDRFLDVCVRSYLNYRSLALAAGVSLMFLAVVFIGDAQTFHREIQQVIRLDYLDSLAGRPLHYWVGQYAAIEQFDRVLDTSHWVSGQLQLRYAIISDSGLLLVAHLCWVCWGATLIRDCPTRQLQLWVGSGIALLTVWLIVLLSPFVLSRYPHWIAGYERLHWFVFVPALVCISVCFSRVTERILDQIGTGTRLAIVPSVLVAGLVTHAAICLRLGWPTGMDRIRGLNSRLEYESDAYNGRLERMIENPRVGLVAEKPSFLKSDDRVLLLSGGGEDRYWLMKQSVFWREPYVEAYALHEFGDDFLRDREIVYGLVDRVKEQTATREWLGRKRISLIVDRRDEADDFLESLGRDAGLPVKNIEHGVWRID